LIDQNANKTKNINFYLTVKVRLKISYDNAKLVYDTVKKNYLDEGIAVNFYEAKEVPHKYTVDIVPIDDVEKYVDSLRE
jgi:hypothetical protein